MPVKHFTPESARRLLERIRPAAEIMSRAYRVMERIRPARILPDQRVEPRYFAMAQALLGAMDSLREAGVQVKDPGAGLIDFPARRAGRTVLLCWKVGEPTLDFWHEEDAGFAGRRLVDEDGPWEGGAEGPSDLPV